MARPVPKEEPQSLLASAVLPTVGRQARDTKPQRSSAWQAEVWEFYDTVGELRYAANWFSNALSRARLYAARRKPDGTLDPVETGEAHDIVDRIFGGSPEKLKEFGKHYFLPGEWYLVGRNDKKKGEVWEVYSSQEVKYLNGVWEISPGRNQAEKIRLTDKDFIDRMWKSHPTNHHEPDSPVRAVLPSLREIHALTEHIRSQTSSRLYSGEMAFFPSEVELPPPPGLAEGANTAESLMALMQASMAEAVRNPGTPEALAPIVVTMPGELIEKVSKMSFWTQLDEKATEMREKAIARMALGLDMPPEVLTGTAGLNHWGSWQVEESSIKAHIEPALDTICAALTESLLVPAQEKGKIDEDIVIAYDTSKLRLRPNRSQEALELWDRGAISQAALLRETGFSGDEPEQDDVKLFVLLKMASGSATPEMVVEAAKALGISGIEPAGDYMRDARPAPSLEEHPTRELPDLDMGALKVVMMRAMERAGNRMKNRLRGGQFAAIAACDLYLHVQPSADQVEELLEDAWSFLPKVVPPPMVEPVEKALNRYAHTIMTARLPITEEGIREHLAATMARRTHEGDQ